MNTRILFCASFLWIAASGCSGSSEEPSESGQSGDGAIGGTRSGTTSAGGTQTGGRTAGTSTNGGQPSGGRTSTAATSGGMHAGGVASSGMTGGTNDVGGSESGAVREGQATGANSSAGSASGGKNTGAGSSGGASSGGGKGAAAGAAGTTNPIVLPEANASFDYQIGGAYNPPAGVRVVSRDRNSAPAAGSYNICYVNGFQIQPDEESFWTTQHSSLILKDSSGDPVVDEGWGEMLLDTSTAAKRADLATIVGGWITQCKDDGFNAVEIDNLDSYSRSNGLLTQANNVAFIGLLSSVAHANGLAIAQKNSSELLGSVKAMGTDFAVVEECSRWDECGDFQDVYGDLIFIIEYRTQDFQKGCTAYPELSIVLRDVSVSTPGGSRYVYEGC